MLLSLDCSQMKVLSGARGDWTMHFCLWTQRIPILLPFWWDYLAILHQISLLLVLTVRHLFYFHLLTFLLFIFLHSYSSFKCKQTAKISMCKKKEGIFTPLRLNNLDVLPQETLWVSFTLTCCNWLFTLWWAKGFSLKIPFCKQL